MTTEQQPTRDTFAIRSLASGEYIATGYETREAADHARHVLRGCRALAYDVIRIKGPPEPTAADYIGMPKDSPGLFAPRR